MPIGRTASVMFLVILGRHRPRRPGIHQELAGRSLPIRSRFSLFPRLYPPLQITAMSASPPHYYLFCGSGGQCAAGRWRFVLRSADGANRLEADDVEPGMRSERLELLAVVRGLEALDQPSHVTLITSSAHLREGVRYGLSEWRRNGWRWECFGQMVPVKNHDLWQRVDRAMRFHQVDCSSWRFDPPHDLVPPMEGARPVEGRGARALSRLWKRRPSRRLAAGCGRPMPVSTRRGETAQPKCA